VPRTPDHGFLILDKPVGISSAKAVGEVKRLLKCKKIGHGGTLDPLASGVLPLAIGEATKAFDYVASAIKEYRFTVTFGEERDTGDAEGVVTQTTATLPTREGLLALLPQFTGTIMQTPPIYSALKINGQRAYDRARAGEQIEMTPRPVQIHTLELISFEIPSPLTGEGQGGGDNNSSNIPPSLILPRKGGGDKLKEATFSVTCGKGTYVRSLGQDIARKVSSLGYISMLRRVSVGKFHENKAISLDKLPELVYKTDLFEAWVPIELALDDIPAINVDSVSAQKLRHGQAIGSNEPDGKYMALHQGRIVALVESGQGTVRSVRVFNL
jgi:tRNA pseudouridine55 synthase